MDFIIIAQHEFELSLSSFSELMISDRHQKREIRQLEQELPRWQVLVDSITGMQSSSTQGQAYGFYYLF